MNYYSEIKNILIDNEIYEKVKKLTLNEKYVRLNNRSGV